MHYDYEIIIISDSSAYYTSVLLMNNLDMSLLDYYYYQYTYSYNLYSIYYGTW